jgi:hypothetical protein
MRRLAGLCLSVVLLVAAPPPAPQHVSATVQAGKEIVVSWSMVAQAASYNLYRGTRSHTETLYTAGIISHFFFNSAVTKGPTYYYQVAAVNRAGQVGPRSAEVSASLMPAKPQPVTHPVPVVISNGMNWGTFLIIVALLLIGAGIALFAWQRTRGHAVTTIPTAHLDGDLPQGGVANFPSGPLDRRSGAGIVPEGVPNLPATIFPGEGLVARYGASAPPAMPGETIGAPGGPPIVPSISSVLPPRLYNAPSLPPPPLGQPGVLEDSEPLRELFNDGMGATTFAGAPPPAEPLVPNHLRQLGDSGRIPVWPNPPQGMPAEPNSTRSLLFIIAGTCVVLGIMALVLFAFFAAATNGTTTAGTTTTGSQTQPTAAAPSATAVSPSPSPSPTAVATPIAINAGGGAVGPFIADKEYSGGITAAFSDPIDTSKVQNPAPQQVYQTERWGSDFTYTILHLTPGAMYTVRLHFAEDYFTDHPRGKRIFNVAINDQPVLTNFDIAAAAGGADIAIVEQFSFPALSDGTMRIHFTNGPANNAKINGIEIIPGS